MLRHPTPRHVAVLPRMAEPFDAGARASAIHPSRVDDPAEQGPCSDGPEGPDHPALTLTQRDTGPACSRRQTGPATTEDRYFSCFLALIVNGPPPESVPVRVKVLVFLSHDNGISISSALSYRHLNDFGISSVFTSSGIPTPTP